MIVRCIGNKSDDDKTQYFNFNDLRISYTNLINKTSRRKQDLKEQYYFECTCGNCAVQEYQGTIPATACDEMELAKQGSLLCPNCKNCVFVPSNSGKT